MFKKICQGVFSKKYSTSGYSAKTVASTDRIVRIDAYRTPEEIAKDIADVVDLL